MKSNQRILLFGKEKQQQTHPDQGCFFINSSSLFDTPRTRTFPAQQYDRKMVYKV